MRHLLSTHCAQINALGSRGTQSCFNTIISSRNLKFPGRDRCENHPLRYKADEVSPVTRSSSACALTEYWLCTRIIQCCGSKAEGAFWREEWRKALQGGGSVLKVIMCSVVGGRHGGRRSQTWSGQGEKCPLPPWAETPGQSSHWAPGLSSAPDGMTAPSPTGYINSLCLDSLSLFCLNYLFLNDSLAPSVPPMLPQFSCYKSFTSGVLNQENEMPKKYDFYVWKTMKHEMTCVRDLIQNDPTAPGVRHGWGVHKIRLAVS